MPRPKGPSDVTRRLRAYEQYAAGMRKSEIAKELGVTKASVGNWCKKDRWDERLSNVIEKAEEAVSHVMGNEVAAALAKLRQRMSTRLASLELLCQATNESTRLKAIELWFKLAGIKQIIPSPTEPAKGARNLELIQDLIIERGHLDERIPIETDLDAPSQLERVSD